jgi:hypothetical protein
MEKINPELMIQFLNSLLLLDQKAISELVEKRVRVNENFSHHETVQVLETGTEDSPSYSVGILGILNGLCGIDDDGWGFVVAECDTQGKINKFIHKKDRNK